MKTIGRTNVCIAAALLLGACGGGSDTEPGPAESDAELGGSAGSAAKGDATEPGVANATTQKAVQAVQYQVFESERLVGNTATELCVISGVAARFSQYQTDAVHLTHSGYNWELGATSGYAWATCATRSSFIQPAGSVYDLSPEFSKRISQHSDASATFSSYWGDAATFITQVGGNFSGGGEWVRIDQSTNPRTATQNKMQTLVGDWDTLGHLQFGVRSLFLGNPSVARLVRLMGYGTNGGVMRGDAATPGTFRMDVSNISGYSSYWLTPWIDGLCYLTKISGNFDGGAEQLRVRSSTDGWWYVEAKAASGKATSGSARCMAYDQR